MSLGGAADGGALSHLRTAALAALFAASPAAAAPVLYHQPANESPVRGGADDLLMLAGTGLDGDSHVLYAAVHGGSRLVQRRQPQRGDGAEAGEAEVVASGLAPAAIVIRLPPALRARQTYALWVRAADGSVSAPVLINDARPLWLSPSFVYVSSARPGLPRRIRVFGRNLDPAPGHDVALRLTGPVTVQLASLAVQPELREFAADFRLPKRLAAGKYAVQFTRDGRSWVALPEQSLDVRVDPAPERHFDVDDRAYGGCRPDDGADDTDCLLRAIDAAAAAGGGTVRFGAGVWNLAIAHAARRQEGLRLPPGVSLAGRGPAATTVRVGEPGDRGGQEPVLTLLGANSVSGIHFVDAREHSAGDSSALLRLGRPWPLYVGGPAPGDPLVAEVTITGNVFGHPYTAIESSGLPLRDLVVTDNEFGAFAGALELGGDRFNTAIPFQIEDSVIARNVFRPGRLFERRGAQGPLASELGAGRRVDFSSNVADGSSTEYSGPAPAAAGWRAAFFWHLNGSQEKLFIAANTASCSGDRVGDGEAIAFDNNGSTSAFSRAAVVTAAGADSVTVQEAIRVRQNDREIPRGSYYVGHWLFVAEGPGVGQARRISRYTIDEASHETRFDVEPQWDVIPARGTSRITVSRSFWQVLAVGNTIDQRRPACHKENASGPKGGGVSLWAQMADSVVAANRLYDTSGIVRPLAYSAVDPACRDCTAWTMAAYFVDVSGNWIEGQYGGPPHCGTSGIQLAFSAAPTPTSPPPVMAFGLSVASNTFRDVGAGAIALRRGWYPGPPPHNWPLVSGVLIQHNVIDHEDPSGSPGRCEGAGERSGVEISDGSLVHDTVIYANRCPHAAVPIRDTGIRTRVLCEPQASEACGCAPR